MTSDRYILHILDDYLRRLAEYDPFHTYEIGEYYPHLLGYCPLKVYYIYKYGPKVTKRSMRFTNLGVALHDFILRGFAENGYAVEVPFELVINPEVRIRGRIDALGVDHVLELKTTSNLPSEPYKNHVRQVTLYMKATGRKRAFILYVTRNDLRRRIFEVPFTKRNYEDAVNYVLRLHDSLKNDTPPDPEPIASWECKDCPFRDLCPRYGAQTKLDSVITDL